MGAEVVAELDRVRDQSREVGPRSRQAGAHTVRVARLLEQRLKEALGDQVLRRVPEIVPPTGFRGYSIAQGRHGHATWLPFGRDSVVLGKGGDLLTVTVTPGPCVSFRPASDDEVGAQDFAGIVSAVLEACRRHTDRLGATDARRDGVHDLADRVERALV